MLTPTGMPPTPSRARRRSAFVDGGFAVGDQHDLGTGQVRIVDRGETDLLEAGQQGRLDVGAPVAQVSEDVVDGQRGLVRGGNPARLADLCR